MLHSPLTVTEFHSHSDALAPDHGKRVPFSSGTSVSYNYIDYRFKNNTDQNVQLLLWCENGKLCGELRSEREFPHYYEIIEENHHFHKEKEKFFRISQIYRNVICCGILFTSFPQSVILVWNLQQETEGTLS